MSTSYDDKLPLLRTPLIGRERDLAEAREHVLGSHERLLTLTGAGGCGKTSLALQLAANVHASFADGVYLVELASINDARLIVPTIAAAVGLHDVPGQPLMEVLVAFLQPRAVLLVLDNCEHLVDACAERVVQLLSMCPRLRILATSREPLLITGERQRRIAPLPVPEPDQRVDLEILPAFPGVQLFVERARAAEPSFQLTADNAATVAAICTRLDGIPLGLELAAARLRVLTVEQIAERVDDWFRLLATTSRSAPTRQQTLRATLDWSYDLLTPAEQAVFRRLVVFPAGASLAGVEAVCAGTGLAPDDVLDLLARLVDKSLVLVDAFSGAAWYRQLEPIRQYGRHQLTEAGELDDALDRHADFYLALAERAAPELVGPDQVAWLARFDREQGNLRAAIQRLSEGGDSEAELRLEIALSPFWEAHGHFNEGRGRLEATLAAATGANPALRARALASAGRIAHQQTDYVAAEAFHQQSLELAREHGDALGIASSLTELGKEARLRDHHARAMVLLEESLALCRALGDRPATASALLNLGITTWWADGDLARSQLLLEECLELYLAEGHLRLIAITQAMLGFNAWRAGNFEFALRSYSEALEGHHRVGDWWFIVYDLRGMAAIFADQRRAGVAACMLGSAHALSEALGEAYSHISGSTFGPLLANVQKQLSEQEFEAAWARGLTLAREAAVRDALEAAEQDAPGALTAPAPRGASDDPDALTRREHEVALLLARGYTDRQIAEELSIAVSTVGVHVHHILAKLDLRSRHQVADWVAAQHLPDAASSDDAVDQQLRRRNTDSL